MNVNTQHQAPKAGDEEAKKEVAPGAGLPAEQKAQLPAVIDYGDDAGAGAEGMTKEEFKIPLLRMLQANSPQVTEGGQGFVEGAKPGNIFNTATGEIWDAGKTPLLFIPVYRDHNFVEYIPREPWGGGFVGVRAPDDTLVAKLIKEQGRFGSLKNEAGTMMKQSDGKEIKVPTEIVETYYLYGLIVTEDEQVQYDVVPFTSTQISKYQNFMTRYNSIRYPNAKGEKVLPPLWAHQYLLGTRPEKNKKGTFQGWTLRLREEPPIKSRMALDDPLYGTASAFHTMLKEGNAKIDREAELKAGGEKADD